MALAARPIFCQLNSQNLAATAAAKRIETEVPLPLQVQKLRASEVSPTTLDKGKILLQPRLCTLRSYGSDRAGVIKRRSGGGGGGGGDGDGEVSPPFFATLSEYIESSRKSQDFETFSGRLAMIVFAGTVTMEVVTGNSLFRKMDLQGIAEAAGVCLGAITCAAIFAWFSSARNRVGRIFTIRCNTFIDSLIDQIIDGLFYDSELSDWSDEI